MRVDGIRLSLLKHCMPDVVSSIGRILKKSFETAVVPANMKESAGFLFWRSYEPEQL
jgi:hypothetical protein